MPWQTLALWVWLAGSIVTAGRIAWRIGRFRALLRHARPGGALQERADPLAQRLGLRRCPEVLLVPGAVSPMVWALGTARVLFPVRLAETLEFAQVEALLAHELAHIRRRDHWVRYLEIVATVCFWWHPILWWARSELHEAEEQCCDAWAVWAASGSGRAYAVALVRTVEFFSTKRAAVPAVGSGVGQVTHLRRRLVMIMQGNTPRSLSWVSALTVLVLGLFVLPLLPVAVHATDDDQPPPRTTADQRIERLRAVLRDLDAAVQATEDQAKKPDAVAKRRAKAAGLELEMDRLRSLEKLVADSGANSAQLQAKLDMMQAEYEKSRRDYAAAQEKYRAAAARLAAVKKKVSSTDPTASTPKPADPNRRLDELERPLERIIREVEELRRENGQKNPPDEPLAQPERPGRPAVAGLPPLPPATSLPANAAPVDFVDVAPPALAGAPTAPVSAAPSVPGLPPARALPGQPTVPPGSSAPALPATPATAPMPRTARPPEPPQPTVPAVRPGAIPPGVPPPPPPVGNDPPAGGVR